jgi:oligoribonuclease NrnB/cAMP/cGMP phosphodiesterase (DHH superfamily)
LDLLKEWEGKKVYGIHDSDLDGVGSRVIAEYYLRPICDYTPLNTSNRDMSDFDMSEAEKSDVIIFVDITPTKELYEELIQKNKSVYIFDHHKSGRELLGELPNYYFDLNRCGARIFFEEITEGKRRKRVIVQFVELVNTYDMWKRNSILWNKAKSLHNILYSYSSKRRVKAIPDTERHQDFVDVQLQKFKNNKQFFFTTFERRNAMFAEKREKEIYKDAKKKMKIREDGDGNRYVYIEVPSKMSIIASNILDEYDNQVQYLVGYCTYDKESTKVSLRSKGEFDVTKIAEKFGGGGHKNSSGVELEREFFNKFRCGIENLI